MVSPLFLQVLPLSSFSFTSFHKKDLQYTSTTAITMALATSNSSDDAIKWGIIGLGDVCTIKAGPAFYKANGSTLSAVMRRTPGMAQSWIDENAKTKKFPNSVAESIRGFESIESMLNDVELDSLYVATPPGAHLEVIRQIVNSPAVSKLKAIYVENLVADVHGRHVQ